MTDVTDSVPFQFCALLAFLCLKLLRAVVKQLLVHLHEEFKCIIDQPMNRPTNTVAFPFVNKAKISIAHTDNRDVRGAACPITYLFQWVLEFR